MQSQTNVPESGVNGQGNVTPSQRPIDTTQSSVTREFYNFLADIEDLVKETTSLTGADLDQAKARLGARIATARESFESMSGTIAQRARQTASVTNEYVHERPWRAIGASTALAFLLGFVVARRC